MAPKRGRNPRGKVRMEKRALPPSTRGPDSVLSILGGVLVASSRPPCLGSRAVKLKRVVAGRVADSAPMARRQVGGEGQRVPWRLTDAQPNSGSNAMSTGAATPDCSGEGAMTSSYDTLYVGIHGVHRAV